MRTVQDKNGIRNVYATTVVATGCRETDLRRYLEERLHDSTETRVNLGTGVWALPHYGEMGVVTFDVYTNRRTDTHYFEEGLGRLVVGLLRTGYDIAHRPDPAKEQAHLDF